MKVSLCPLLLQPIPAAPGETPFKPAGATYVRWGRTVCPESANLVYKGKFIKKKKKKKKKKHTGDFKCTMPPDFTIPRGLSTLYRCSLTTLAQDKSYHEIPLIRDCCNHKGSCTLFRSYLIIAAGISSSGFVRV